jgi:hypothetical protein
MVVWAARKKLDVAAFGCACPPAERVGLPFGLHELGLDRLEPAGRFGSANTISERAVRIRSRSSRVNLRGNPRSVQAARSGAR